jgi:predicted phosphoribosyltransferase
MMFADREDAARQLAVKLSSLKLYDPIVLAIPRGGVVTGAVLAKELKAELEVVLSRKLRAPFQPELAIGAVGEDGEVYVNQQVEAALSIDRTYLEKERQRQLEAIKQRQQLFRAGRGCSNVKGRSAILTDDGIATGSTMMAAIRVVKAHKPRELIVAVPVAPARQVAEFRSLCDQFICLLAPVDFSAVGEFYRSFETVEDEEVIRLLKAAKATQQPV